MEKTGAASFEFAMGEIKDGKLFESFAQAFLCQVVGVNFVPLGGVHDKGQDGLEHCSRADGKKATIYQISIEADPEAKIRKTIVALQNASIDCGRLHYVSNRRIPDQTEIEERIYDDTGVNVRCHDVAWLAGNVGKNEGTLRTYLTFIETHLHQYAGLGASPIVADFETDPRLFVFLRQQLEASPAQTGFDQVLSDGLILFALEGTDPDKGILMSREEIRTRIGEASGLSATIIDAQLDRRLKALSEKPRRINHHQKEDKYCLPFETRLELGEKNLADAALHRAFTIRANALLTEALHDVNVRVKDAEDLLNRVIAAIFKGQGLEFADFMMKSENAGAVERSIDDIISGVVEDSSVVPKNRKAVATALLGTIRFLIYRGTAEELAYLQRLSHTYLMLFVLRCDPKLATYFSTMAGGLRVLVDNSIIVPAMSERPLDVAHRRYWNLLLSAHRAGVRLYADKATIAELASHIRRTLRVYKEEYEGKEEVFLDDSQTALPYVKEILIRSYFYAAIRGAKGSFDDFIDLFVTPGDRMEEELATWLAGTFGIRMIDEADLVDKVDRDKLAAELEHHKHSGPKALSDADTILTVYGLRKRDRESGDPGIFGYKTWWLSRDIKTQVAVEKCFGAKYRPSCYMRPDFLYNYISLAPSFDEANRVFDVMFPTLLGVTISHHVPDDVAAAVHLAIKDHGKRDPARVKAMLKTLGEKLKTDAPPSRNELKHFFDDGLRPA